MRIKREIYIKILFIPRKVYKNIWGGTLKYVTSGEYEFGQHVRIDMKSSIFVQLNENFYL